ATSNAEAANGKQDKSQLESAGAARTLSPAECLQGRWLANNEFFLAATRELGDVFTSVTGEVFLEFGEAGALTTEYRSWLLTATVEGQQMTILRVGTDICMYVATDSVVDLTDTITGS